MLRRVHRRYGSGELFILWFVTGLGSISAVSQFISARIGDTVILPCKASEVSNQTYVYWETDSHNVLERCGAFSWPGPGYKGRVDVPMDELCKGSCSLVLKNVSVTDAAVYRSYIKSGCTHARKRSATRNWHLIQNVTLSVQEVSGVPDVRDDANLDNPHPWMIVFFLFLFFSSSPFMSF